MFYGAEVLLPLPTLLTDSIVSINTYHQSIAYTNTERYIHCCITLRPSQYHQHLQCLFNCLSAKASAGRRTPLPTSTNSSPRRASRCSVLVITTIPNGNASASLRRPRSASSGYVGVQNMPWQEVNNNIKTHIYNAETTRHAAEHMRRCHPQAVGTAQTLPSTVAQQICNARSSPSTLVTPLNTQHFKDCFIEWLICDDITYRQACSRRFRDLVALANPLVTPLLPQSHNITIAWMKKLFVIKWEEVKRLLGEFDGKINVSFDLWTSVITYRLLV